MRKSYPLLCAMLALLGPSAGLAAQELAPVALVESVRGQVAGVEFMDYVSAGKVIKLGPGDAIVLGYLKSCLRETIVGGTVIVVEDQSLVQGGRVERVKVDCDSKRMQLGPREAAQGAATVYRGMPRDPQGAKPSPLTLYGRSPIVELDEPRGSLLIERLDAAGERIEIDIAGQTLLRGKFLDLAQARIVLVPGARYAATLEGSRVEFRIAAKAKPGATPFIGRLLRFP